MDRSPTESTGADSVHQSSYAAVLSKLRFREACMVAFGTAVFGFLLLDSGYSARAVAGTSSPSSGAASSRVEDLSDAGKPAAVEAPSASDPAQPVESGQSSSRENGGGKIKDAAVAEVEAVPATRRGTPLTPESATDPKPGSDTLEAPSRGSPSLDTVVSVSNKILNVETITDPAGRFLVLTVATDVSATRGSDNSAKNIPATCTDRKKVVFRLDPVQRPGPTMEEMIRQAASAAERAPFRAKLTIVRNECVQLPGSTATHPVAIGLLLETARP